LPAPRILSRASSPLFWIAWKRALLAFHGDEKVSDEIGRRNLVQFRTGADEEPTRKWKLKQQFESFWPATSNDNFYASSGAISVAAHPRAGAAISAMNSIWLPNTNWIKN
jgi:hypothetical protein